MADPNEINPNDIASVQEINLDDIAAVDGQPMFRPTTPEEIADEKAYNRIQIEGPRFLNALGDDEAIRYEMGAKRHKARLAPKPQERPFNSSEVRLSGGLDDKVSAAMNTATMGWGPKLVDVAKSAVRDPSSIAGMAAQLTPGNETISQDMFGMPSRIPVTETRDYYDQATQENPIAGLAGQALNPLNYTGMAESAKSIGLGLTKLEQWISNKLGGKALNWVNEYAEKIALRGTNASPEVIQTLRKTPSKMGLDSALDDIKYSVVNELQPGVIDDSTKTAQDLSNLTQKTKIPFEQQTAAKAARDTEIASANMENQSIASMNDQYMRPAREGVLSDLNKGKSMKVPQFPIQDRPLVSVPPALEVDPAVSASYERASQLEKIMSPGVQSQISHVPSGGLATTPVGAFANAGIDRAAKVKNTAILNSATSVAKRALERLQSNINPATAPFQKEETMRKLQSLAQMADAEAAAYSYAESMANPAFRQLWLDASEAVDNDNN